MTDQIIAVIDQDVSFLTSINETLAASGYIAVLSQGNEETRHLIQREHPSLIIMEGSLCEQDAEGTLAEMVIADAGARHIPFLVTVPTRSQAGPDHDARSVESLAKPIDPAELQSKIAQALAAATLNTSR